VIDPLRCPVCHGGLEPTSTRHGLLWLCQACRAGAATVPILRRLAPRAFVDRLWQTALHDAPRSRLCCPSCAQPFTELVGPDSVAAIRLEVCVRCFWVWIGPQELSSLRLLAD